MIIAVDGPSGAGKSTVARILAKRLGFLYIDTGAMYRALTLKILENKIPVTDIKKIIQTAGAITLDLVNSNNGSLNVILDGKDVSAEIRKPVITQFVSDIAKIKEVRQILVGLQREMGKKGNCILDGRDIGTVVFPQAEKKFFIDASAGERVNRRFKELKEAGLNVSEESVSKDLSNRDRIDSTREASPLRKAEDAIYIDTTNLSIEEVVDTMAKQIK